MKLGCEKGKEKGEDLAGKTKEAAGTEKKKSDFFGKAVLAVGLMAAAAVGPNCGSTREIEQEADNTKCVADLSPVTCDESEPVAKGIISKEKSLAVGDIIFRLSGTEDHRGETAAIIEISDKCGNVIARNKSTERTATELGIAGAAYEVTVNTIYRSETDSWADVSIKVKCNDMCEAVSGTINLGESLVFDNKYLLQLDDIEMHGEKLATLDSIMNKDKTELYARLKISKGEPHYLMLEGNTYKIVVNEMGAGYTLNAKWADFTISKECGK